MSVIVSIIMATYNRADLIADALLSIQRQTFTEFECLIIDDGGKDNTLETIQPVIMLDSRFQYMKRPDKYLKGLPGARNFGLDIAKGDYIIFFDDDDIVHEQNLETCVSLLQSNLNDFIQYAKHSFIGKHTSLPYYEKKEMVENIDISIIEQFSTERFHMASCTVMWKRHCFNGIRFKEGLQYAEEWECYIRILLSGRSGQRINKVLYFNRKHNESNTGAFYSNNINQRKSKVDAAIAILSNLDTAGLLSPSILKHFVMMSWLNKDLKMFQRVIPILHSAALPAWKYRLLYWLVPFRLKYHHLRRANLMRR